LIFISLSKSFFSSKKSYRQVLYLTDVGGGGLVGNTAEVLVTLDTDVSDLTPADSPRVAHGPVVGAGISSVANELHAVVKRVSAVLGQNTLEARDGFKNKHTGVREGSGWIPIRKKREKEAWNKRQEHESKDTRKK
jgi:hypothetical protein